MYKVTRFFFAIFQSVLLFNSTKQSAVKQAVTTFKAIGKTIKSPLLKTIGNTIKKPIMKTFGNTMKNSMGMFRRNKNTVKNFACGFQTKYLSVRHNIGITAIKYLGKEGVNKFKYIAPQAARGSKLPFRTIVKNNIQIRSTAQLRSKAQMNGKQFKPAIKNSIGQMMGKDIKSLINMASKSKPQLPFLFAAGGIERIATFNLNDMDKVDPNEKTQQIPDNITPLGEEYIREPHSGHSHDKTIIWMGDINDSGDVILLIIFI